MSRARSSSTVRTKWEASRSASSTSASSAIGSQNQVRGVRAMRCGSKVQTRSPVSWPRSCAVAAHRSLLFAVATTGPGADSTAGTARAVVFPDRGAMIARITSSHDANSRGPRGRSSPRTRPTSPGCRSRARAAVREGRSRRAVSAAGPGVIGRTSPADASDRDGSGLLACSAQRSTRTAAGTSTRPARTPARASTRRGGTPGHRAAVPPPRTTSTSSSGENLDECQPCPDRPAARSPPAHSAAETVTTTRAAPGITHGAALPPPPVAVTAGRVMAALPSACWSG